MKTQLLPSQQEERNAKINRGLKSLGVFLIVTIFCHVLWALYIYGRHPQVGSPEIVAADGQNVYGPAVILSSDTALCLCSPTPGSEVRIQGKWHRSIPTQQTAEIISGVPAALVHLDSPVDGTFATPSMLQDSQSVQVPYGGVVWTGQVKRQDDGLFVSDSGMNAPHGMPVYSASDPSALVGMTAEVERRTVIIPISDILQHFPEK